MEPRGSFQKLEKNCCLATLLLLQVWWWRYLTYKVHFQLQTRCSIYCCHSTGSPSHVTPHLIHVGTWFQADASTIKSHTLTCGQWSTNIGQIHAMIQNHLYLGPVFQHGWQVWSYTGLFAHTFSSSPDQFILIDILWQTSLPQYGAITYSNVLHAHWS